LGSNEKSKSRDFQVPKTKRYILTNQLYSQDCSNNFISKEYHQKGPEKSKRVFDYSKMSADVKDDNKIKSDSDTENREMEIKTTEICHLPFQKEEIENDEAKKIKMQNMTIEVDVTTISINVPIKVKEELTNSRGTTDGTNSEDIRIFIHHI